MKTGDLTIFYGAVAVLSVLLLAAYVLWEKKREKNFLFLLGCVSAANVGYFLLAVAGSLAFAKAANVISYFGSAYAVLAMMFIIADVCRMERSGQLRYALIGISTAAFLLAASGDWLGLYYTGASIKTVNGMTRLVKEYGPLHILYTVYLLGYILGMVGIILYAWKKQKLTSPKYTMLLMMAVLLNLGVWAVEQAIDIDFEFLSVSYIVTEIFLLLLYGVLRDFGLVQPGGSLVSVQMLSQLSTRQIEPAKRPPDMEAMFHAFAEKGATLSLAERRILDYYIEGYDPAEIPELAYISIHTVKKHNRSIYQKLEVASRDELMLYIELFRCCDRLQELTATE